MTKERIAELKALAAAATGGPWEVGVMNDRPNDYTVFVRDGMECHQGGVILNQLDICRRMDGPNGRNNAEFIAAARDAIPALIAEVEEEAGKVINPAIVRQLADCRARLAEAERERDAALTRAEEAEKERDYLADTALTALAGAGIATPEKGYKGDMAGWLGHDIQLLRAERDAARERAEKMDAIATFCSEEAGIRCAERDAALARAEELRMRLREEETE